MYLTTSNKNKIAEFKSILGDKITIKKGKDVKEVNGNIDEVIIYKSLDSRINSIVEDTILEVDGKEVVDIRYYIKKYSKATVSSYEGGIFKFKDNISEAKYFTFSELVNIHLKYNKNFEYLEIDLTPKPIDIKINLDYKISRV